MLENPLDHPFETVLANAQKVVEQGGTVYQKWTCQGCGERVTGNNPNAFYAEGKHEECGHVTDIREHGCNFLVMWEIR